MADAALFDASAAAAFAQYNFGAPPAKLYVAIQLYRTSAQTAAQTGFSAGSQLKLEGDVGDDEILTISASGDIEAWNDFTTGAGHFASDTWHLLEMLWDTSAATVQVATDGTAGVDNWGPFVGEHISDALIGCVSASGFSGQGFYVGGVWFGTNNGLHDILQEDWSTGDFSRWSSHFGAASVVTAPSPPPTLVPTLGVTPPPPPLEGRVLIAFDDGPLVADPTWTRIDDTNNLVAKIETRSGKQTNRDSTDTGQATVYLNDTSGDWDPLNASSPYFGKLDGKQILIQIWNPVTTTWYPRWRGTIDGYGYTILPVLGIDGKPILANIQIDCVDVFDYLVGYELTPGLDGDVPPAGQEGVVFYEDTMGTVDDRIIQILTDATVDPDRSVVFSGNISAAETTYESGSSALAALRDAADAEAPTIANIYTDRFGRFVFHGFYSRTDPDGVAATTTADVWDFQRWKLGDATAITADADRAQIRVLGYSRSRSDIINAAVAWPKGMAQKDMPGQVFVDTASISAYGRHSLSPMTDLIVKAGTTSGYNAKTQCAKYAELIVKNQKDPTERITSIMLKSLAPSDPRAAKVWDVICRGDISDIANVSVGYPGGTGIQNKNNYIEGVTVTIQPLQPIDSGGFDYIEVEFDLTPAEWTMDTHGVFPPFS